MALSSNPPPPADADLESLLTRRRQARRKQLKIVAILVVLVVLGVVADQTLRHTVLSIRTPKVRFSSVAVLNSTTTGTSFGARLEAQVSIKNTNFGRFEYYYSGYGNLTVGVYYLGGEVGEGVIAEGSVGARNSKTFNVTMEVRSGGNSSSDLRRDVSSGSVSLSSKAKLTGIVEVIRIVRKKRDPQLSCTMTLKLDSNTVQDLVCL